MHSIMVRNAHSTLPKLMNLFHSEGWAIPDIVSITWTQPQERCLFWPVLKWNPAKEMIGMLHGVRNSSKALDWIKAAVENVVSLGGFMFSSEQIAVQMLIEEQSLALIVCTPLRDPFQGVLGQLGLQLSFLQEMAAKEVGLQVGRMTVIHTRLEMEKQWGETVLRSSFNDPGDPYVGKKRVRPLHVDRGVSKDLPMFLEQGDKAMGYQSQWMRRVASPVALVAAFKEKDPEQAKKRVKDIKSEDWRLAMEHWVEA
jgi:hypothetical protein